MKDKKQSEHNIVLFPGMLDRMLNNAVKAAENQQYNEAIEQFEKFYTFSDGDEYSLSVFVHCLYEAKKFERAKEVCEDLIALEPDNYLEVMELYLTICMQLKQFMQVEKIIHSMLERKLIPTYELEKFQRIKRLNEEIAENRQYLEEAVSQNHQDFFEELALEHFLSKSDTEKMISIQQLSNLNIRPFAQQLISIIETKSLHPFIKSLLLIMLVEQQVGGDAHIEKWGIEQHVDLNQLPLPTSLPQYQQVEEQLVNHFEQDPSIVDLVSQLLIKHAIVAYPFEWAPFQTDLVIKTYKAYIEEMFGLSSIYESKELYEFIVSLEKLSDLQ
jgi:tetratricopeptide (TPR) repeat protein